MASYRGNSSVTPSKQNWSTICLTETRNAHRFVNRIGVDESQSEHCDRQARCCSFLNSKSRFRGLINSAAGRCRQQSHWKTEFLRKQKGLSQHRLATLIGRSQGQYANAVRGHDPFRHSP